jgi:hypothetical protein
MPSAAPAGSRHRKDKTMPRETDVIYGMTAGHGAIIEVDEAIFGLLTYEKRPGEAYNDVVRRLLGMPPKDGAADEHGTGPPRATQTLLLCDGCYQSGTGLLAECEDGCPHDLDHTGLCLRGSPGECQWCGKPDRLREVLRASIEHPLPTVGEEDEGRWWLHFTDGAEGPFPSAQAAWDYWHGNPPPPARTPAGGGGEGRA